MAEFKGSVLHIRPQQGCESFSLINLSKYIGKIKQKKLVHRFRYSWSNRVYMFHEYACQKFLCNNTS